MKIDISSFLIFS